MWTNGARTDSELWTGDLLGLREGSDYCEDPRVFASSAFYTPLTRSATVSTYGNQQAYCDTHSRSGKKCTATMNVRLADVDPNKARKEQIERARVRNWPAALQKVVVGDVKESGIAKRRRSTLGRRG